MAGKLHEGIQTPKDLGISGLQAERAGIIRPVTTGPAFDTDRRPCRAVSHSNGPRETGAQ